MTQSIRKPLSQARSGEHLAADVTTPDGQIILRSGACLSETLLQRLARLGVVDVLVVAPTDVARIRAALDRMFEPWQDDEVMQRLKELLLAHRTGEGRCES